MYAAPRMPSTASAAKTAGWSSASWGRLWGRASRQAAEPAVPAMAISRMYHTLPPTLAPVRL